MRQRIQFYENEIRNLKGENQGLRLDHDIKFRDSIEKMNKQYYDIDSVQENLGQKIEGLSNENQGLRDQVESLKLENEEVLQKLMEQSRVVESVEEL